MAKFRYMNFPKTSANYPKLPQDKSKASRESFRLVADFSEISRTSRRHLGESLGQVPNFLETSPKLPRQVAANPGVSPTLKCHPHVTLVFDKKRNWLLQPVAR